MTTLVSAAIAQAGIGLLGASLTPLAWRFQQALRHPEQAQRRVQQQICDRLRRCAYGQAHGIQTAADWDKLPIVTYEDVQLWVEAHQPDGLPNWSALIPEPIQFYERTSGSRGAAKTIPYSRSLRATFNHLFCLWAQDVICHGPRFTTGKTYICVSPQLGKVNPADPPGGDRPAAVGLETDADYLSPGLRRWLQPYLVMPPGINRIQSAAEFQHRLALTLLAEPELEIMSIWSPSFLTAQLRYITAHQAELAAQLGDRLSPSRRDLLRQTPIPWAALWPHLKLISCWDSAQSADSAQTLRHDFPHTWVQGKGLLATEAPMTVPLIAAQGCVPLLSDVLFECEDEAGTVHPLTAVELGQTYQLIISPIGGFYRYRIGDRVRVTHWYQHTPCLEFVGRDRAISDLVGEKLQADFVQACVTAVGLTDHAGFRMMIPTHIPQAHYVLLLDHEPGNEAQLATALDHQLQRSPQYAQARLLDQLAPVEVCVNPHISARITQYQLQQGKTWGDIKFPLLDATLYPPEVWRHDQESTS